MSTTTPSPPAIQGLLVWVFQQADKAGFGIADGTSFEAFPGCEDAAADFIEKLLDPDRGQDR
ncbi:hypothetical protein [Aestuariimicrobium sp. Y1814]|uniref:hypothetical protein n=1 Tax=Aestuariimicrobium sp. Y1814 TaxID=3418742 RepID=UPI003DA7829D